MLAKNNFLLFSSLSIIIISHDMEAEHDELLIVSPEIKSLRPVGIIFYIMMKVKSVWSVLYPAYGKFGRCNAELYKKNVCYCTAIFLP